jgi:hypothetical protein
MIMIIILWCIEEDVNRIRVLCQVNHTWETSIRGDMTSELFWV